jgi:hypothetical protein
MGGVGLGVPHGEKESVAGGAGFWQGAWMAEVGGSWPSVAAHARAGDEAGSDFDGGLHR